ncbi:type II secretion system minor pseudopilin GspI [Kordiimonas pumila]|uniref:Type II secretion system protein I n=1 Tax=Kordiimonas pumila TaxID=2161677 RepID=A0ABV7D6N6_9PROT|nr:type II secretion system minor pseudopilin GspI [Kordiimonas pumila]
MNLKADNGFSLIEMLVATAILALTAVALLDGQAGSLRVTHQLQDKTLAAIVADNRTALALGSAALPVPGNRSGEEDQLGSRYMWREQVRLMPENDILVIDIAVLDAEGGHTLVKRTAYRRAE